MRARSVAPSARELEVLSGLAYGKQLKQIAADLCLSRDTVKTHLERIYAKLSARNAAHAVAIGLSSGLIRFPSAEEE